MGRGELRLVQACPGELPGRGQGGLVGAGSAWTAGRDFSSGRSPRFWEWQSSQRLKAL